MKVTFFGSSHGVPEPNRRCSCALLEAADRKYLIDIGMDPVPELITRGLSPVDITAVFVTHVHGDHINGLVPFADICSWYFKSADPLICLPDSKPVEALRKWTKCTCGGLRETLRFETVSEGVFYDDGVICVNALPTGHMPNAYAYMIEAEGKKVLFSGDLKHADGPLSDYARFVIEDGLDLAIVESAHFDATLYLEPLRAHPPKRLCINHYSQTRAESCYKLKSELKGEIPVVLASDGLEINIP